MYIQLSKARKAISDLVNYAHKIRQGGSLIISTITETDIKRSIQNLQLDEDHPFILELLEGEEEEQIAGGHKIYFTDQQKTNGKNSICSIIIAMHQGMNLSDEIYQNIFEDLFDELKLKDPKYFFCRHSDGSQDHAHGVVAQLVFYLCLCDKIFSGRIVDHEFMYNYLMFKKKEVRFLKEFARRMEIKYNLPPRSLEVFTRNERWIPKQYQIKECMRSIIDVAVKNSLSETQFITLVESMSEKIINQFRNVLERDGKLGYLKMIDGKPIMTVEISTKHNNEFMFRINGFACRGWKLGMEFCRESILKQIEAKVGAHYENSKSLSSVNVLNQHRRKNFEFTRVVDDIISKAGPAMNSEDNQRLLVLNTYRKLVIATDLRINNLERNMQTLGLRIKFRSELKEKIDNLFKNKADLDLEFKYSYAKIWDQQKISMQKILQGYNRELKIIGNQRNSLSGDLCKFVNSATIASEISKSIHQVRDDSIVIEPDNPNSNGKLGKLIERRLSKSNKINYESLSPANRIHLPKGQSESIHDNKQLSEALTSIDRLIIKCVTVDLSKNPYVWSKQMFENLMTLANIYKNAKEDCEKSIAKEISHRNKLLLGNPFVEEGRLDNDEKNLVRIMVSTILCEDKPPTSSQKRLISELKYLLEGQLMINKANIKKMSWENASSYESIHYASHIQDSHQFDSQVEQKSSELVARIYQKNLELYVNEIIDSNIEEVFKGEKKIAYLRKEIINHEVASYNDFNLVDGNNINENANLLKNIVKNLYDQSSLQMELKSELEKKSVLCNSINNRLSNVTGFNVDSASFKSDYSYQNENINLFDMENVQEHFIWGDFDYKHDFEELTVSVNIDNAYFEYNLNKTQMNQELFKSLLSELNDPNTSLEEICDITLGLTKMFLQSDFNTRLYMLAEIGHSGIGETLKYKPLQQKLDDNQINKILSITEKDLQEWKQGRLNGVDTESGHAFMIRHFDLLINKIGVIHNEKNMVFGKHFDTRILVASPSRSQSKDNNSIGNLL